MKQATAHTLTDYKQLLLEIRSILDKGLGRAYQVVDNIRVQTYWQVGERIIREELKQNYRANYGKRVIEQLARDLGFSRRTMFEVVQFYKTYPIVRALPAQLTWTHFTTLIRIKNVEERRFYESQSIINGWTYRELQKRIRQKEYKKAKKIGPLNLAVPKKLPTPSEVFKDIYDWGFLQLGDSYTEKDLEAGLIDNIRNTLLELGRGFFFGGQQINVQIAGLYHKIDLLFYHRNLKCLVIIDLKKEKFKAVHVGQMNKYLTYFRKNDKEDGERDPIGLIICQSKNSEEVHYALGKLRHDIFVAEYQTKLPSEAEIKRRLQKRRGKFN